MEYIKVGVNSYFCYKYVGDGRRAWLSSVSEKNTAGMSLLCQYLLTQSQSL